MLDPVALIGFEEGGTSGRIFICHGCLWCLRCLCHIFGVSGVTGATGNPCLSLVTFSRNVTRDKQGLPEAPETLKM